MELLNQISIARARFLFAPNAITADCLSTDVVGSCVYISGPATGEIFQVTTADPRDGSKIPAIGVILSKYSSTRARVQIAGPMDLDTSLTLGKLAFVGMDGLLTNTAAGAPLTGYVHIQSMGVALSSTQFLVVPNFSIVKRKAS